MRKVASLSSADGRKILHEIFHELKYKKQLSSFSILANCWKICVYDIDLTKYIKTEDKIEHRLGLFKGTSIWMEEIVNRFYFSVINSFVYFGAAVLLVIIGVRRFSDSVDDSIVIAGVVFEAIMLFFMFIVMFFSPSDDDENIYDNDDVDFQKEELLTEIGEIAKEFAISSIRLESISNELVQMNDNQQLLIEKLEQLNNNLQNISAPNPDMLQEMKVVNTALSEFKDSINILNSSTKELRKEEVEITVRRELEKILSKSILER